MNYLGHAFLSFGDRDILLGNMIGDHIKGLVALGQYPEGVRKGIILHRKIDGFVDIHPATLRSKILFKEEYGLYAGAIMDTLYDHYLANDPKYFANEDVLLAFSQQVYDQLAENEAHFPLVFAGYYPYMKEHNWLYNYHTIKGMEKSLNGLARRAKYMNPIGKAYEIFIANYYHLNQCYYELIDDLIKFVKTETGGL